MHNNGQLGLSSDELAGLQLTWVVERLSGVEPEAKARPTHARPVAMGMLALDLHTASDRPCQPEHRSEAARAVGGCFSTVPLAAAIIGLSGGQGGSDSLVFCFSLHQ